MNSCFRQGSVGEGQEQHEHGPEWAIHVPKEPQWLFVAAWEAWKGQAQVSKGGTGF